MKPSHQRLALATAGAALLASLLLFFFSGTHDPAEAPPALGDPDAIPAPAPALADATADSTSPESAAPRARAETEKKAEAPKPAYARITVKAGEPIPELFPFQAERDRLMTLATTYDASNVPAIASSLNHSDATVREAARQALVQIGHSSAIPYLKAAEASAKDPTEAEAIKETIDFLSLPHVIDVLTLSANAQRSPQP